MTLETFAAEALATLINTLLPAAIMAAGVWMFLGIFPRLNAATRYVAWWTVMAAILSLPLVQWSASVETQPAVQSAPHRNMEPHPEVMAEPVKEVAQTDTLQAIQLPIRIESGKAAIVLGALWAAGTLASLVRLLLCYLDLRGILKRARPLDPALLARWTTRFNIRRPVRLLASEEIGSPLAAGFLRPAVLVPESLLCRLDDELADHVVIHELAHIGRRDDWANLLGRLLQAALWFHPVARWILRRLEFERELACDDWVVAATPSRRKYAASLTRLAELRMDSASHSLAASMVGKGSQVGRRVRSLLDPRRNTALGISRLSLTLALAVMSGLLLCGSLTPGLVAFSHDDVDVWEAPEVPEAPQAPPAPAAPAAPPAPPAPPAPSAEGGSGFLAALASAGYNGLDIDEIIELKVQGVTANFIREMNSLGFGKLTTRQLVEIRIHGVTPTYLADLKKAGISGYTLEQARDMRVHGVRPAEIIAIHALGFGPYNARQVQDFAIHGVRESFFRALKDNGITQIDARDAIEARIHGVSAANIREAKQYGSTTDIRRIIKLKQAGVL